MHNIKKSLVRVFLVSILFSCWEFAGVCHVLAQAPGVIVVIGSDTRWTKADSPHTLTGPVFVVEGVTLTIEAGANVNMNDYYILVNGTLVAVGGGSDTIHFNKGNITITVHSNGWNEQTGSGCVIENAVLSSTSIYSSKAIGIKYCSVSAKVSVVGPSVVSHNTIWGDVTVDDSTLLSNNTINGKVYANGLSTVSDNVISGTVDARDSSVISNNSIMGSGSSNDYGVACSGSASVSGNVISGWGSGVGAYSEYILSGGYPLIENNLITNNTNGVKIGILICSWFSVNIPTVVNNTISHNSVGIKLSHVNQEPNWNIPLPTIIYNNIHDNSEYNFYLDQTDITLDVSQNWWGTADTQAINLTIYDYKYDFDLGTVNFVPFLTEPNPEASIPIPEFQSWFVLPLFLTVTFLTMLLKQGLLKAVKSNNRNRSY